MFIIPGNTSFHLLTTVETKLKEKKSFERRIAVNNHNKCEKFRTKCMELRMKYHMKEFYRKQTKNISFYEKKE